MNEDDWNVLPGHGLGPFEFDLDRDTIVERLEDADIKFDVAESEPALIELLDEEVVLTLSEESPHRLLQIEVLDDRVRVDGEVVIGRRPHELIDTWSVSDNDTRWRYDPEFRDPPTGTVSEPAEPVSDRQLLTNGTLWVLSKGLGLKLYQGEVEELLLRPQDFIPERGSGSLTEAQRELLSQRDLFTALEPPPLPGSRFVRVMQQVLTFALIAVLAGLFWQATQFQQRWNNSVEVEGTVIAVNPPPPETFPDEMTIEYADRSGKTHQVVWKRADVYITREVGEKVAVHYLEEAPDQPLGPARVRDASFLVYFPYGIGAVAIYLVLILGVGLSAKFFPGPASEGT
ncbi:MAG TPA: DUF3592 domain-containing protein [Planctomycetaceae bacterium]|jgi:hypothetical protein|nr:DUF3592 domain-containing protein [Planctomycetaceae bacterium]